MSRAPSPLRLILTAGVIALVAIKATTWLQTAALPNPVGTGSIEGVVVDDLDQPIPRAALTLRFERYSGRATWSATADRRGRFALAALPAGEYTLQAYGVDHVRSDFTERAAGWGRTPIALGDGGRMRDLRVRIARAATIAGVVRDADDRPLVRHTVGAVRLGGGLDQAAGASVTNSSGHYEIRGLEPGDYIVAVREPELPYVSLYYPGVRTVSAAKAIAIHAAEIRTNVDVRMAPAPVTTIDGALAWEGAAAAATVEIFDREVADPLKYLYRRWVRSDATARFVVTNLPAGRYLLVARATIAPSSHYSGSVTIESDGVIPARVRIPMTRGARITGRATRETAPAPHVPLRLAGVDVESSARLGSLTISAATAADGTFVFADVPVGRYRMTPASDVAVMAVDVPGRAQRDGVIEVGRADVRDVRVQVALRSTQVMGTVRDASGRATGAGVVVALLAGASHAASTARLHIAMPSTSGRFLLDRLPPGEFDLVAVATLSPALDDDKELEALRSRATRISLRDGEQKHVDLTLR